MNRETFADKIKKRRIEEIAKDVCKVCVPVTNCKKYEPCAMAMREAKTYYELGYRKEYETAKQIIADIDNRLHDMAMEYYNARHPEYFAVCEMVHHKVITPVEKKYIGEHKE